MIKAKPAGPSAAVQRQLKTVRGVFQKVGLEFKEAYDRDSNTSYFDVDTGVGEIESLRAVHSPGLLAIHAVLGVKPPSRRRAEVERFAMRFNAAHHEGCMVVRENGRVVYRASVDYSKVKDLEAGYVAALIENVIDTVPTIDLPLIAIAKGKSADAAIRDIFDTFGEAKIEPS